MAGKTRKIRVDELLLARGLADSLDEARALVMAGKVVAAEQRVDKPSLLFGADIPLRVKEASRYVSRAGDKLAYALADLKLSAAMEGAFVLDIGASTGGFTDCCLAHGAKQVIAVDVGTNQLAWELRNDARVIVKEQTDIRAFDPSAYEPVNFVVADVSFNSLARLAPYLQKAAPHTGVHFILLVKPQFELPRERVPDGGVVHDETLRLEAVAQVQQAFVTLGFSPGVVIPSRVKGRSGNAEVFLYLHS